MASKQVYDLSDDDIPIGELKEQSTRPHSPQSDNSLDGRNAEALTDDPTLNEDTMENTQAVLNRPKVMTKKKLKVKAKGIGKMNPARKRQFVQSHPLYQWLNNYWDTESTMILMGQFIKNIKEYALANQQATLGKLVRPLSQIMKTFIMDISKQKLNLKSVSWDTFEAWALDQELSMTYGSFQMMEWMEEFDPLLFQLYGKVYLKCQEEMESNSEAETEDETPIKKVGASSSSRNTKITSISSTTVPTVEDPADADSCDSFQNVPQRKRKSVQFQGRHGSILKEHLTSKSKTISKSSMSGSAKRPKVAIVEEEQDPHNSDSDALEDMLDGVVQQQCLRPSIGCISQNICLKHQEQLITLKSPGERGTKTVKLEIYPYSDCLRKPKNEWWKTAVLRSQFLTYSEDSHVAKLVDQLTKEIFKQIRKTKNVEIETKSVGFKSG